jgi:DNA-binding MltR family transcriptional regulator
MINKDEYFDRLHLELDKETDRSVAIIAVAIIDETLKQLIERLLIKPKNKEHCVFSSANSPLGSLSSKINASYQLGFISEEMHRDLQLLRKIRNDFAHKPFEMTFNSNAIKSRVIELDKVSNYISRNAIARENTGPVGVRHDFIFSVGWRLYALQCQIDEITPIDKAGIEFGYFDYDALPEKLKELIKAESKT